MFGCPRCSKPVFSLWRKVYASSACPARCPSCSQLVFVSGWAHVMTAVLLEVAFWGSIGLALWSGSWFALALFPVALVALSFAVAGMFPLETISVEQVAAVRRSAGIQIALLVLVVAAVGLWSGGR